MSKEEAATLTPAYASFVTITNTLDLLKADGVPPKFDRSLLSNMSGSSQSQIMVAFRYLGFVDDDGNSQPVFKEVVYASNEERKGIWKKILTDAYPYLLAPDDDFNIEQCAPSTFNEKLRAQGINGATLEKAIRFFLQAAEFAEIKISKHVKNFKTRRSSTPRTRKTTKKVSKPSTPTPQNNGTAKGTPTPQAQLTVAKGYEILQALLQKLPSDFQWTQDERDRWIMAHTAVLDLHVAVVEDEYEDYDDEDYD